MTVKTEQRKLTYEEWNSEGTALFGPDKMSWKFECPMCGHVASTQEYKDAGATSGAVGFSCVGRWSNNEVRKAFGKNAKNVPKSPCDYAGGGLIGVNPWTVADMDGNEHNMFAFAKVATK